MREGDGDLHAAIVHVEPLRRREGLKLPGSPETSVLFGIGVLRRAHRLPFGVCVAVGLVDAKLLEQQAVDFVGEALHRYDHGHRRRRAIHIVVVPEEHRG